MYLIYFILAALLFLYIRNTEGTLITPSSIIVVTWCLFPGIASMQPLNLYELSLETHIVVLVSLFSFLFAYYYLLSLRPYKTTKKLPSVIEGVGNVNYKLLIVLNIVALIWLLPKTIASWGAIQIIGWDGMRREGAEMFGSTAENTLYMSFARPLFVSCLAIISVDLLRSFKLTLTKIIFILLVFINIAQETVIFAARATLIKVVIYVLFSYLFVNRTIFTKKKVLIVAMIVFIMYNVLAFITAGRNENASANSSFFETMIVYYIAPFGVLNYYINSGAVSAFGGPEMTYGTCLTGFIYNLFCTASTFLFGVKYVGSDYLVTNVTGENVYVARNWSMNAATTADYCFLKDFGLLGVIIGFVVCAVVILKIRKRYHISPSIRNGAIYIFMLYSLFRLAVFYDFLSISALFSLFYIWIGTVSKKNIANLFVIR